jgi:predicted P-loop ATPase
MAASRKFGSCTDPYVLAETIAHLCEDPHPEKEGWRARCPNHQGTSDTSLSLTPGEDRVLLNCFGGCAPQAVVAALNLTMADLFIKTGQKSRDLGQIVQIYDYYDAAGSLVHQTVRYAPKAFRQRRPDPANPGRYLWDLKTIQPVLYHLPDVLMAIQTEEPVYLTEGEKDADTLVSLGFVATCNPMGAGKWDPTYSESLRGASVVILAHFDTPGTKHAELVAKHLHGLAQTVRLVHAFHTDTPGSDFTDWLEAGGTKEEFEAIVNTAPVYGPPDAPAAPPGWSVSGVSGTALTADIQPGAWRKELFSKKNGELTQNVFNIMRILENHEHWLETEHALWFDTVRQLHMHGGVALRKSAIVSIAAWFGSDERLPLTNLDLLRDCLYARCEASPRDTLQYWVNSLPAWDGTARLDRWLIQAASVEDDAYGQDVSRILPVGMIARALMPGCPYRYVVILQGEENTGKSALVRALASPEWYYAMKSDFESKEAHMEIQGAWVAELPELDSLNRTGETRLKAFITLLDDSWVPKYANDRITVKRRTVFVGTTNEETFLKGQTGNTRFVPIKTGVIDMTYLDTHRLQLFAEAKRYYEQHPDDWWHFSEEGQARLEIERDARRRTTPYEDLLSDWLLTPLPNTFPAQFRQTTTWEEIATDVLKMATPEHWKDKVVQGDISASMRALGWKHTKRRVIRGGRPKWVYDAPEDWGVPF